MAWAPTPISGVQPIVEVDDSIDDEKTDRMADFARLLALSIPPEADDGDGDDDSNAGDEYTSDDEITAVGYRRITTAAAPFAPTDAANDYTPPAPLPAKRSFAATVSVIAGIANLACVTAVVVFSALSPNAAAPRNARLAVVDDVHRAAFAATERAETPAPRAIAVAKKHASGERIRRDGRIVRTAPF